MARGTRYLTFEGQFESSVLGTSRIIRGFADLKDLAEISVPYEMEDGGNGAEVIGQHFSAECLAYVPLMHAVSPTPTFAGRISGRNRRRATSSPSLQSERSAR